MTELIQGANPRTGEPTGFPVAATTADELNAVVAAAYRAFASWSEFDTVRRAYALRSVADRIDQDREELVAIADLETALGQDRLNGEVGRTTGQLRMFASVIEHGGHRDAVITPAVAEAARPDLRRFLIARGPVAVFAASNFPFAFSVAGGDTASALAAGCTVVVKGHEAHPATSAAVARHIQSALRESGAPDGTFGIVYGPDAGLPLVEHPSVSAVGFTGSLHGGRTLFDAATRRPDPIPFFGELGSINPVFLLPGAAACDIDAFARGYIASLTLGTGQFCTKPGLVFVPKQDAAVDALRAALGPAAGGPMLTARMAAAYRDFSAWDGLEVIGTCAVSEPESHHYAQPELRVVSLSDFIVRADELSAERFGPAGLVVTYDDAAELVAAVSALRGSLTATIHAAEADYPLAARLAGRLQHRAGRLIMNGWPTGVAVCWAQHHGGPWPATTEAAHTSVGARAIARWLVPVVYQNWPAELLPPELREDNPMNIPRFVER